MNIVSYERCVLCCNVPYHCAEQRGATPLALCPPCVSYSATIWSLLAVLHCTKPYCGFPEISRERVREKGRGGGERPRRRRQAYLLYLPRGGHAGIPKDTGAKGLVALLPTSCTHKRGGDAEIYVMVTQSLPLLNSLSPLTACKSEGESLGVEGCWCFHRTEVEWNRHNVLFLLF